MLLVLISCVLLTYSEALNLGPIRYPTPQLTQYSAASPGQIRMALESKYDDTGPGATKPEYAYKLFKNLDEALAGYLDDPDTQLPDYERSLAMKHLNSIQHLNNFIPDHGKSKQVIPAKKYAYYNQNVIVHTPALLNYMDIFTLKPSERNSQTESWLRRSTDDGQPRLHSLHKEIRPSDVTVVRPVFEDHQEGSHPVRGYYSRVHHGVPNKKNYRVPESAWNNKYLPLINA